MKPKPQNTTIKMAHVLAWKLPRFHVNLKLLLANGVLRILLQVTTLGLYHQDGTDALFPHQP